MFRKLLPNEGTPKSLCSFPETEIDNRFTFKVSSNVMLVLLSQCNRMFFVTVRVYLIVEETALLSFKMLLNICMTKIDRI